MTTEPDRPNSMFARAVSEAAEENGGRFARNTEVSIAGVSPIPHADKLAAPTWCTDVGPEEPPLGYEIDAVPDLTTVDGLPPLPPDTTTDEEPEA
jgi:hypothetical protein